ncbi:MAG TPA: TetR/AcrR family transcriptional regulator [Bacteroidia bacterium]|nr:TetR/AcrR family transcriptional regulator [Bacteroidia bacterium]
MKTEAEDRIIESATELFYRFGIKSITMDDVAKHLAMSKKTLYQHFRDKNEMVRKCCEHDILNRTCMFKEIASLAVDPINEMMNLMKHMESMFSGINPNLFYDMQKYYPEVWKLYREFKEKSMMQMIEENFKKGIDAGLYRRDISISILARLRMEEVEMGFNHEFFPHDKFSVAKVQVALFDHFMHGITTIKGHKLINKYKQIIEED